MTTPNKIVIIGIDGGTFNVIDPLIKKGELPNIQKIIENGVCGKLRSTIPPTTIPAWPSFMTGKNPGKHGVFGFTKGSAINQFRNLDSVCFWDILAENDKNSIVVNVPMTYPPKIKKGVMVSGMLTPEGKNDYTYPKELVKSIEKELKGYAPDVDVKTIETLNSAKSWEKLLKLDEKRYLAVKYLQSMHPHDLTVVIFQGTDIASHRIWDQKDKIAQVYKKIDEYIGKLMPKDGTIFVISDHGFNQIKNFIRLNQFFEEKGLLCRVKASKQFDINRPRPGKSKVKTRYYIYRILNRMLQICGINQERLFKFSKGKLVNAVAKITPTHIIQSFQLIIPAAKKSIDYPNSKCFLTQKGKKGIKINANDETEYYKLRKRVKDMLEKMQDPRTGQKVFKTVIEREKFYSGKHVKNAPDIILDEEENYLISPKFGEGVISRTSLQISDHEREGIFLAYGNNIKKSIKIKNAEIIDIAPTVLHLSNMSIPEDMDGKVLEEVFSFKKKIIRTEKEAHKIKDRVNEIQV